MTDRRLQPPDGYPAPTSAPIGGATLQLDPVAREICRRYAREFPDEGERYGTAGAAWCVHDNKYLLFWAADSVDGYVDLHRQVAWLAALLEARRFPLARLARNLDLSAAVIRDRVAGVAGERLAAVLDDAAAFVRARATFLEPPERGQGPSSADPSGPGGSGLA